MRYVQVIPRHLDAVVSVIDTADISCHRVFHPLNFNPARVLLLITTIEQPNGKINNSEITARREQVNFIFRSYMYLDMYLYNTMYSNVFRYLIYVIVVAVSS